MAKSLTTTLLLALLLSIPTFAFEDQDSKPFPEEVQAIKKRVAKRFKERRHTVSITKQMQHMPAEVYFEPTIVNLPDDYHNPPILEIEDGQLDLESLRPSLLKKLSATDLDNLLLMLGRIPIKITWRDKEGHRHVIKGKRCHHQPDCFEVSNAAAALALKTGTFSFKTGVKLTPKLFASMVASLPEAILPAFRGLPGTLLDIKVTAQILAKMINRLENSNSATTSYSASLLTELFIKMRANKDVEIITGSMNELLRETQTILDKGPQDFMEQKIGLLLGSVLSGAMQHAQTIRDHDQKRLWITNMASNLVWASTSFIGIASIASSIAAGAAGGISIAAVLVASIRGDGRSARDFTPDIKEVEGQIELAILEAAKSSKIKHKVDVLLMLSWMRAVMLWPRKIVVLLCWMPNLLEKLSQAKW